MVKSKNQVDSLESRTRQKRDPKADLVTHKLVQREPLKHIMRPAVDRATVNSKFWE